MSIAEYVANQKRFTDLELKISRLNELVENLTQRFNESTSDLAGSPPAERPRGRRTEGAQAAEARR